MTSYDQFDPGEPFVFDKCIVGDGFICRTKLNGNTIKGYALIMAIYSLTSVSIFPYILGHAHVFHGIPHILAVTFYILLDCSLSISTDHQLRGDISSIYIKKSIN